MATKYNSDMLDSLVAMVAHFDEIEERIRREKAQIISRSLEIPVGVCARCRRITIPRRLWRMIPKENKPRGIAAYGSLGMCISDYNWHYRRNQGIPDVLTPEQLATLRKAVGA